MQIMKKMYLMLVAAVLAISFSAFTTIKKAPAGTYQYKPTVNSFEDVPPGIDVDALCPQGNDHNCIIEINGTLYQIYLNGTAYRWQ
jgi:hypothetical protein